METSEWLDNWKKEFTNLNAEERNLEHAGDDMMDAFYTKKNAETSRFMKEALDHTDKNGNIPGLQVRYEANNKDTVNYDMILINLDDSNPKFLDDPYYNYYFKEDGSFDIQISDITENAEDRDIMLAFLDLFTDEWIDYAGYHNDEDEYYEYGDEGDEPNMKDYIYGIYGDSGLGLFAPKDSEGNWVDTLDGDMIGMPQLYANEYMNTYNLINTAWCVKTPEEQRELQDAHAQALENIFRKETHALETASYSQSRYIFSIVSNISMDLNAKLEDFDLNLDGTIWPYDLYHSPDMIPYSPDTLERALNTIANELHPHMNGYYEQSVQDCIKRYYAETVYDYPAGLDVEQHNEIKCGLLEGLDVNTYAHPEIYNWTMRNARKALEFGVPADYVRRHISAYNLKDGYITDGYHGKNNELYKDDMRVDYLESLYRSQAHPLTHEEIGKIKSYIVDGMTVDEVIAGTDAGRKTEIESLAGIEPDHSESNRFDNTLKNLEISDNGLGSLIGPPDNLTGQKDADPVSALIEEARASADAHNASIKQNPVNRDNVQIGD